VGLDGHGFMLSLYPIIDNGFVFVGFFFLLSGFVLAYNYLDRQQPFSARAFWFARLARLYPVYLLTLAISWQVLRVEWQLRPAGEAARGTVLSLLMLQAWFPRLATFWTTVGWAVSCEAAFYLLFPWLLRVRWPARASRLLLCATALWALGMLPYALYLFANPDHAVVTQHIIWGWHVYVANADRYNGRPWLDWLKYTPLPYGCTFLVGMALGKVQLVTPLSATRRATVAIAGFLCAGAMLFCAASRLPYVLMMGGVMTPAFAAILVGLSGPHWLSRALAWRPLMELGVASYCLYLLHYNVIVLLHVDHVLQRTHLLAFDPWISYALMVLIAWLVYRLVERPCQRVLMRWWKEHRSLS
jgi:peptidoglycan/LPS O-acetylase OafA/YrhL